MNDRGNYLLMGVDGRQRRIREPIASASLSAALPESEALDLAYELDFPERHVGVLRLALAAPGRRGELAALVADVAPADRVGAIVNWIGAWLRAADIGPSAPDPEPEPLPVVEEPPDPIPPPPRRPVTAYDQVAMRMAERRAARKKPTPR